MTNYQSSTLLTVGTVLKRAIDRKLPVKLRLDGIWIEGRPVAIDQMTKGVLLETSTTDYTVVQVEAISAVIVDRSADRDEHQFPPMIDERDAANLEANRIATARQAREQGVA